MAVSVIQILRAMGHGDGYMRTLPKLKLHSNSAGAITYYVGNSAVLFRAFIEGRWRSLKCYNSPNPYRSTIYGNDLLPCELYAPTSHTQGQWVDVTISDWVEGRSLAELICEAIEGGDVARIGRLGKGFDSLALELLLSDCAHGDITCDNIIVDNDLKFHLIDRDAAFTPALSGRPSLELGTQAFQHPARSYSHFDASIDDYSICLISTALAALAIDPTLYHCHTNLDGLLFDPAQATSGSSPALQEVLALFARHGRVFEYAIAKMLTSLSPTLPELHTLMRHKIKGLHPANNPAIPFCHNGLWGYLNPQRRQAIPAIFDEVRDFRDNIAAARIGDTWHYINPQAQVVFNGHEFKMLKNFRDGHGMGLTEEGWIEITLT